MLPGPCGPPGTNPHFCGSRRRRLRPLSPVPKPRSRYFPSAPRFPRDGTDCGRAVWRPNVSKRSAGGGCPPRGRAGAAGAGCPRAELLLGARVRSAAAVTPLFPSAATGSVLRDRDFISLSLDFSARPGAREQRHRRFLPPPEGGSGTKLHDPPYAAAAGPRGRALLLHGAPAACCAAAGLGNC